MWEGITDLRESLLERGMLNEALTLFKIERTRIPPMERLDAVIHVRDYIRSHFSLTKERSVWVEADLAIYAAQSLYESGEGAKGAIELIGAQKLLDEWRSLVGYQQKETLTPALNVKLTRVHYNNFSDEPMVYYKESTELLELMKKCCHASTKVCFGHVIEATRLLMTSSETDQYRAAFYERLDELQEYEQTVLEDISGMLFDQEPLFTEASFFSAKDSNRVLEWLDGFEKKYPDFDIPEGLRFISSYRRGIYSHRHQTDKKAEEDAKMERLKDKVPSQYGPLVAMRKPKPVNLPISNDPRAETAFAIDVDVDEDNFSLPWAGLAGKSEETRTQALRLVVQWMIFDFTAGIIKDSEIIALLGIESGIGGSSKTSRQVDDLCPDATFRKLYLCGEGPSETVIDVERWVEKSIILKSWLCRPSKPSLNGRQYLLVVLQEIRKDTTIELKAPIDVIILEYKRCISVVETLRPKVKEFVATKPIFWRGGIADQYFYYCIKCPVFNSGVVGEYLASAVDISLEVIDELQKLGNIMQSTACQILSGEMCLYKLYWMLLQPGHTISDPKLVELQKIGLDCLEEADDFFTPLLKEVTWSLGLESVQERERYISTSSSWRIPQLAVRLLVAGGIPADDEKRKAIWTWVQRSKARALAMGMGTTGGVPAALLQQIMASEQYRLLYEAMSSLEQQIQTVEPQNRFALRQKMDIHILEMRKHRPLAEVCDIRNGKALTWPDLDGITAVSKSSVVLVDWFYLCLDAYDKGSILLLTAKSGTTPTISILSVAPPTITEWINANLDGEFSDYTNKDASELGPLVQPLVDLTEPGEELVFCATSNLNRIPLHSIDVEEDDRWRSLIYRNPIVHIHSHSVLRMCLWNAQEAADAQSPLTPLIMNGIPDIPSNAAWSVGRASVQELASFLDVVPYLNTSGTKANFLTMAPSSRLIHIHSHVEWTDADPLAHSIQFAPPASNSANADTDIKLTAREIFALSFPLGSHVSLIACLGGLARISPEDEVMGLVPALLHAGASSTISTLWPIADPAGAYFADAFYRALEKAREGKEGGGWIDLARVFQTAVIERDKKEGQSDNEEQDDKNEVQEDKEEVRGDKLHWPAFVMHGFWQLWVPPMKKKVKGN